MPIFEYHCLSCGEIFERFILTQKQEASTECPECGSTDVESVHSVFSSRSSGTAKSSCDLSHYS